ncbi:hypothetical protein Goshw_005198 [Gossypium schwendimanii]|uniref:Uncharacterized protein n=1 Tax=Gossypium schwendimanii TaxID=34291 RepID=A0A7J9MMS4_GOSSC|nr:hypothetical protein [Gossypium schwendimanii]
MDMLPILPPTLRRPPSRPTKMRRREFDEPQTTTKLTKKGVTKHKTGVHNQVVAPTHEEATPTYQEATLREKLSFKRKPVGEPNIVRWMPSTKESSVLDPSMRL